MLAKIDEIEALLKKHYSFNIHKKISKIAKKKQKLEKAILEDENNRIITGIKNKLKIWNKNVETLFNDNRQNLHISKLLRNDLQITKSDVRYAIKKQKTKKSTGPDRIYSKMFKTKVEKKLKLIPHNVTTTE